MSEKWSDKELLFEGQTKEKASLKIQVGFRSLEGREEDDRPEDGLHGHKCGDRKLVS